MNNDNYSCVKTDPDYNLQWILAVLVELRLENLLSVGDFRGLTEGFVEDILDDPF